MPDYADESGVADLYLFAALFSVLIKKRIGTPREIGELLDWALLIIEEMGGPESRLRDARMRIGLLYDVLEETYPGCRPTKDRS